jgi:hypothetical protein
MQDTAAVAGGEVEPLPGLAQSEALDLTEVWPGGYAPASIDTVVNGFRFALTVTTAYPDNGTVRVRVEANHGAASEPYRSGCRTGPTAPR